jgi:hypothetical protein
MINHATPAVHQCFFCRQAGQPVQPVTLVLSASQWTPDWMPREIEVDTWACLDEASCGPMATARHTHPAAVAAVH